MQGYHARKDRAAAKSGAGKTGGRAKRYRWNREGDHEKISSRGREDVPRSFPENQLVVLFRNVFFDLFHAVLDLSEQEIAQLSYLC